MKKKAFPIHKFTKQQRREAYIYVLLRILDIKAREVEHIEDPFMCYMLGDFYKEKTGSGGYATKSMLVMFPELKKHKPKDHHNDDLSWFPWWETEKRIKILTKIINKI